MTARPAESVTLVGGIAVAIAHLTGAPIDTTTTYVALVLSAAPAAITWLVAHGGLWRRVHGLRGILRALWTGQPAPLDLSAVPIIVPPTPTTGARIAATDQRVTVTPSP